MFRVIDYTLFITGVACFFFLDRLTNVFDRSLTKVLDYPIRAISFVTAWEPWAWGRWLIVANSFVIFLAPYVDDTEPVRIDGLVGYLIEFPVWFALIPFILMVVFRPISAMVLPSDYRVGEVIDYRTWPHLHPNWRVAWFLWMIGMPNNLAEGVLILIASAGAMGSWTLGHEGTKSTLPQEIRNWWGSRAPAIRLAA